MLVSKKPCRPNANHPGPNVSPNVSPWNIVCIGYARDGFALGIKILCCLSHFCLHLVPKSNMVSGGIWALEMVGIVSFTM